MAQYGEHWPFEVIRDGNKPKIRVEFRGQQKLFSAREISSIFLIQMKETAHAYLDKDVKDTVITISTHSIIIIVRQKRNSVAITVLNARSIIRGLRLRLLTN